MRNSRKYLIIYLMKRQTAGTTKSEVKEKNGQGDGYWDPLNSMIGFEETPDLPYFVQASSAFKGNRTEMSLQLELGKSI
jgi:hypothetical protein